MGYKDPEKAKAYHREYMKNYRAKRKAGETESKTPVQLFQEEESEFRIKTAGDILELLADTIRRVQNITTTNANEAIQQARAVGYLAGVALKAVETANIEGRIEAIETILNARKENAA